MKKKFYHATNFDNLNSIYEKGILKGYDGVVYLTETREDALKFVMFRQYKNILVLEVELDEDEVFETFDHSYTFFQCKAFATENDIPMSKVTSMFKY